jgi:DNA-directed RNA polymerase II subunit RPB3
MPEELEKFDYDAEPERFYINLETVGGVEADRCFQQGIDVLQRKLADIIAALTPRVEESGTAPTDYAPQSPDAGGMAGGYGTEYGGAYSVHGGQTQYGDGRTPYGAGMTAYGNNY